LSLAWSLFPYPTLFRSILGAASAQLLGALLDDVDPPFDPSPFDPHRF
jgi:hypothetical protein